MNLRTIILKNTLLLGIGHAFSLAAGLTINFVLARYLGVESYGYFSYIFAFYYFLQTLNDFGINPIVVREVSRDRSLAGRIIGTLLLFRFGVALVSMGVAAILIQAFHFPVELRQALMIYSLILPLLALQHPSVIFQVVLEFRPSILAGIVSKFLSVGLILFGIHQGFGVKGLISLLLIPEALYTGLLWIASRPYVRPILRFDQKIFRPILSASITQGVIGFLVAGMNRLDFLMLERMSTMADVGLYATCYRITNLAESLFIFIMASIFPLMSRYAKENPPLLRRLYHRSWALLTFCGLVICGAIGWLAPWIIRLLFGISFLPAVPGLQILILSSALIYFSIAAGNLLVSVGREKANLWIYVSGFLLNTGLNYYWIPQKGFIGAAQATVAAYGLVAMLQVMFAECHLKKQLNPTS